MEIPQYLALNWPFLVALFLLLTLGVGAFRRRRELKLRTVKPYLGETIPHKEP